MNTSSHAADRAENLDNAFARCSKSPSHQGRARALVAARRRAEVVMLSRFASEARGLEVDDFAAEVSSRAA